MSQAQGIRFIPIVFYDLYMPDDQQPQQQQPFFINSEALNEYFTQLMMNMAMNQSMQQEPQKEKGLSETLLQKLQHFDHETELYNYDHQCVICQEDMFCSQCERKADHEHVDQNLIKLPCGHAFHDGCVSSWLKMSEKCPTCRFTITEHAFPEQEHIHSNCALEAMKCCWSNDSCDKTIKLSCGHSFHKECIDASVRIQGNVGEQRVKCWVCRRECDI